MIKNFTVFKTDNFVIYKFYNFTLLKFHNKVGHFFVKMDRRTNIQRERPTTKAIELSG